ncbi:hypothetical protein KUV28_03735 [Ferrimonas balearica]|nr:hypothetical protein [Ferrimonas balearica]
MTAYDRLSLPENMNFAWKKVRRMHQASDGYLDHGEFYEFELNLEDNLNKIREEMALGKYKLNKIRPLPRPKKYQEGKAVDRQYYHISTRDQVAWMAFVNAVGPLLDEKMEAWSYGNRLYRAAWYERKSNAESKLEFGPYRHSSGNLYKKFQNSWPLFRRHVSLTTRMMALGRRLRDDEMDDAERLAGLAADESNLIYFSPDFFNPPSKKSPQAGELYHASIDLKQFYPNINTNTLKRILKNEGATSDPRMERLLDSLLDFKIDMSDVTTSALENVEPKFLKTKVNGIPTGLYVSGFLSNCVMIEVDRAVQKSLKERRNIAHFRFVDDHTILSYDFDILCNWIDWYQKLLEEEAVGAVVNEKKVDPPSLSDWLKRRSSAMTDGAFSNSNASSIQVKSRDAAIRDTKIDGRNPTKLMTKTLTQVSAIAATDLDVLDDRDLEDRFKMLEWLLLADIPEREIRPDTRAAFAAGQIAALAPILIQETDGIVTATRREIELIRKAALHTQSGIVDNEVEEELQMLKESIKEMARNFKKSEHQHLKRCFDLLMQSFRDHPGKARLFFKIQRYLQVTGYDGLKDVGSWIAETRSSGNFSWASYYSGLSFQILARLSLSSTAKLKSDGLLRSDTNAAFAHLTTISKIDLSDFLAKDTNESWFHRKARIEFSVALRQCGAELRDSSYGTSLPKRLEEVAVRLLPLPLEASSDDWIAATGRSSGVWAHAAEELLQLAGGPTIAWSSFAKGFDLSAKNDALAVRRYPHCISGNELVEILNSGVGSTESDAGWFRDVVDGREQDKHEILSGLSSKYESAQGAWSALQARPDNYISVEEWTKYASELDYFDPRRSEWTALEIACQMIQSRLQFGENIDDADLLYIHPKNVFLPMSWILRADASVDKQVMNWSTWQEKIRSNENGIKINSGNSGVSDYRFAKGEKDPVGNISERQFSAIGRFILGMVRLNHSSPSIWNIRGNESVHPLTKREWFERVPISSLTLRVIEACLGWRAAETRLMKERPSFFGNNDGEAPNDTEFDPPELSGPEELLQEIEHARDVLEENQISVTLGQPRQLIPFKLADFASKLEEDSDGGGR